MSLALKAPGETHAEWGQARVLAELLRGSRITLLLGADPSVGGRPWFDALMRQLRRRAGDRGLDVPTTPPPQERRTWRVGPIARCDAEVVVFFDAWDAADPLDALRARLDDALGIAGWGGAATLGPIVDTLAGLNQQLGARFLFVFDRFERFLEADPERPGIRAFTTQWQQLRDDLTVAANFLVALSDEAEHLLVALRERMPDIDRHWVRLPRSEPAPAGIGLPEASNDSTLSHLDDDAGAATPFDAAESTAPGEREWQAWIAAMRQRAADLGRGAPGDAAPPPPPGGMTAGDVYAAVEAMLARTAALHRESPWGEAAAAPTRAVTPTSPRALGRGRLSPRRSVGWVAVALMASAIGAVVTVQESARAPSPSNVGRAPDVVPVPPAVLRVDAVAHGRIVDDLVARLPPMAGSLFEAQASTEAVTEAADAPGGVGASGPAGGPRLELMRYDRLRRLHASQPGEPLRIVGPFFTEELHFLVRDRSALSAIHQIEASRINIGPTGSTRAETASSAYAALFGRALPAAQADRRPLDAALPALLDGRLDVLVLVAAQPAATLAGLDRGVVRTLRPLRLDLSAAPARRALQSFLPARLRAESYPAWLSGDGVATLAVMNFLVTVGAPVGAGVPGHGRFVDALCDGLPALRASGHPKWREVRPDLRLDAGWPDAAALAARWRACDGAAVAVLGASPSSVPSRSTLTDRSLR